MSTLDAVLSRIDQDIGNSVERLFALLRIASISTDPAYKQQCRAAAEHVAADLTSIGFDDRACARPTAIRWWSAKPTARRGRMCCSTAITTCSRSIR